MKVVNSMVLKGRYVYATNVRMEGNERVADGIYNVGVDENGESYRTTEYIVTEDGECVTIR